MISASPKIHVDLGGQQVYSLLDTGAETSLMTEQFFEVGVYDTVASQKKNM